MRLTAFCNFGAADPGGSGYMYAISRQWLAASGLFGAAQGMALPLSQTLPAAHTDYVLVSTIATFGWVAGAGILVLASALIGRIVQVGRRAKTGFGNTLCLGVGALLAAKFLFCIFANLGLLPMLSFGLPFLSYGGTEYVSNLALVGLVLSVWRHNNLLQPSAPPPRPRHTRWFRYEDGELVIRLKEN